MAYLVAEVWEGQGVLQEYYKSGIDSLFNFPASQQDGAIIKTAKARVTPPAVFLLDGKAADCRQTGKSGLY